MPTPRLVPALVSASLLVAGCGGGEDVTVRSLANARRTWDAANLRDYDLEWTASGARQSHYLVRVRRGKVRSIKSFVEDRRAGVEREVEVKPADPSYYGVEGLFKVLDEERAQAQEEKPFGQPHGTRVLLKFTPDPKLGYPLRFRRDVAGSPRGLALDVLRLVPDSSETDAPAPASGS